MKKFTAPLTLALACIVYGLVVVCEFHFAARAQGATNTCNTDCLLQKMDALNQKALAQRAVVERITRDSKPYSFPEKRATVPSSAATQLPMSAKGHKRMCAPQKVTSALHPKADIGRLSRNVR
jgi:hypothetical protein